MKRNRKCSRDDFTLIELLIVVAIIMLLAGMLLPALRSARERARQIQCSSNMKQCCYAMASYASDFNGFVVLHMYKSPGGNYYIGGSARWLELLDGSWGVEYLKAGSVTFCPSYAPVKYESSSFVYGARGGTFPIDPAEFCPSGYSNTSTKIVNLTRLTKPSIYLLIGDSFSKTYNKQIYNIDPNPFAGKGGFHLRHSKQGNMLSGDFHVESADRNKAKNWGISGGYIGTDLITF